MLCMGRRKQKRCNVRTYVQRNGKGRKDLHWAESAGLHRLQTGRIRG
nr:MAG TPA: hypothetical protein [Microviridae sp.]